jgi:hypothetical protein
MVEPTPMKEQLSKNTDIIYSNLNWTECMVLKKEEVEMIADPEWIYENLIVRGHLMALVAEPNGGKTAIMEYIAGYMTDDYRVFYVNADISGGDAKNAWACAEQNGYTLMTPDMKAGMSMDTVVGKLESMNKVEANYSDIVFIFDTLKKMTDVINKSRAKGLYMTLRGLTAKGMTIILLAHTNKYPDADGNPIYEGTADLRSDVDELIYLIPKENPDGLLTVSTLPDKVRATFEPITFTITTDRQVSQNKEFVDVQSMNQEADQRAKDETIIEAVTQAIQDGKHKQVDIVEHCRNVCGCGRRTTENVLTRYTRPDAQLWRREKAFQNNAWKYYLIY